MNILSILKNITNHKKKIDLKKLPTQAYFYKDDFEIFIKKADIKDITEYEVNFDKNNLSLIITRIRDIVKKNTTFSKKFKFEDIKSLDLIFIFIEIVSFTNGSPLIIQNVDDNGVTTNINFDTTTFNYIKLPDWILENYDPIEKNFDIFGFKYSSPSIGVELDLTRYLFEKSYQEDSELLSELSFDFIYFLGHKSKLNNEEIDNLIQIFNYELSKDDFTNMQNCIKEFTRLMRYSLRYGNSIIDVTSKIDLSKVWK